MKKYYIYILTAVLPILWGACNNGDDIDTKHSIFSTEPMEHNGFDEWLLANYTYPYNVDFKYRMQDIESEITVVTYNTALADNHQVERIFKFCIADCRMRQIIQRLADPVCISVRINHIVP